MANLSQCNTPKTRHTRNWLIPLSIFIAALLVTSLLLYTVTLPKQTPEPEKTEKLFQQNLKKFANTIKVDNGKFFVLDDFGNLTCFDTLKGDLLWQTNVGGWRSGGMLVNNGTIYAGTSRGAVQAVDEATGKLLTRYDGLISTAWKGPPKAYSVADGRIFITQDGTDTYNIATGEMLWKSNPITMLNPQGIPYTGSVWAFEGKLVLATGGYQKGDSWFSGIYRIDPDKGTPQWSIEGYTYQTPMINENKVILSNYGTRESVNLCDSVIAVTVSGVKVWSYDVGAPTFKPLIVGDKLLFAAQDGNFYAVNLSNGTLAWKTQLSNSFMPEMGFSRAVVDDGSQEVYWAHAITKKNGSTGNSIYEGTIFCMDLATGQTITKMPFQNNSTEPFLDTVPTLGLALLNNTAYLSVQKDLWTINRATLTSLRVENFENRLLQPIVVDGRVYVSADLYAIAYRDIE